LAIYSNVILFFGPAALSNLRAWLARKQWERKSSKR
jgi:hypothetical protein